MILRLKRNPRRALALLHNLRGDAERERPGVGRKFILHLQEQAPLLVGRIKLDQQAGARSTIRERLEECRVCTAVETGRLHDGHNRDITCLCHAGELVEQRAGGTPCVTPGGEAERVDHDSPQVLDCLNGRIEQRQVGREIEPPRPVWSRYVAQDLHPGEIGTCCLEPRHQHIGIAVGTDQDHRAFRRAAFAAGISPAGGHRGDDVDRECRLAAPRSAGQQRELGGGNAAWP